MSTSTLRGPVWVAVRQHRRVLWAATALLVLTALILLYQRYSATSAASDFAGTGCSVQVTTTDCGGTVRGFLDAQLDLHNWLGYTGVVLFVLPGVVGAFVAGPVIGRELESGTYKLAWTQSVSPARWLMSKLAVPVAWTVVGCTALVVLYRWSRFQGPEGVYTVHWYDKLGFAGLGPLPIAYGLLGIALGALAGLLVRRTLLAMSATALAVGGAMLAMITWVRPYLWPIETITGDGRLPGPSAWTLQDGVILASGERMTREQCGATDWASSPCRDLLEGRARFTDYHPASHFWPLQLMETGIVLVVAAAVAFAAFRVLRRSHA
ncbi:ABC transporter permease [Streptomyces sp. NPDC056835]|uniref:ABC transporter permease n=1 Tax=Streptomyces sp. NPDC056835 TaxID=3345956 RepID=UPI00368CAF9A